MPRKPSRLCREQAAFVQYLLWHSYYWTNYYEISHFILKEKIQINTWAVNDYIFVNLPDFIKECSLYSIVTLNMLLKFYLNIIISNYDPSCRCVLFTKYATIYKYSYNTKNGINWNFWINNHKNLLICLVFYINFK